MKIVQRPGRDYVKVRADFDVDGRVTPLLLRTEDDRVLRIDRILDVRPAPSLKSGGQGLRYTCRIGEREAFLFCDRNQWFLEEG